MPLEKSTIDIQIRPVNSEAPKTAAPVGRLKSMINKVARRFEGQGQGAVLRVEQRPGSRALTQLQRDVTSGVDIGSAFTNAQMLTSFDDELIAISDSFPHVLSEQSDKWSRYPYIYSPTVAKEDQKYSQNVTIANPHAAYANGVVFRTWGEPLPVNHVPGPLYGMVEDISDGTLIRKKFKIADGADASNPSNYRARVVTDGTYFFVVFNINTSAVCRVYSASGVQLADSGTFDTLQYAGSPWDLTFSGGHVLFVCTKAPLATNARVTKLSFDGVSTITATTTDMSFKAQADVTVQWAENRDSDGNAYLLTASLGDSQLILRGFRIGTLSGTPSVTGAFSVEQSNPDTMGIFYETPEGEGFPDLLFELTGAYEAGTLKIQASFVQQSDVRKDSTLFFVATIGADTTTHTTIYSVRVASRPFKIAGRETFLAYYSARPSVVIDQGFGPRAYNDADPTYFLIDVDSNQCVGRLNFGYAEMEWARINYPDSSITNYPNGAYAFCIPVPFIDVTGPVAKTRVTCGFQSAQYTETIRTGNDIIPFVTKVLSSTGVQDLVFGGIGRAFEFGDHLLLPGAICTQFDGQKFSEHGVNLPPNQPSISASTGGSVEVGLRSYIVVAQYTNLNGDRVFSGVSTPAVITTSGSQNTITLTGLNLHMTTRDDITFILYRNIIENGVPSQVHYRLNDPVGNGIANDPTAITWTYVDTASDADIKTNEPLYTDQSFLSRDPCPAYSVGTRLGKRAFVIGPDNAIWYSGELTDGIAPWFNLAQRIPKFTNDEIVTMEALDSRLICITRRGVWYQDTSGLLDATGNNGNIPNAVELPFSNGSLGPSCVYDKGVAYASVSGGVWVVTRGLTNERLSGPVVDDMTETGFPPVPVSGIVIDNAQRIHAAIAGSKFVVYDAINATWSTFQMITTAISVCVFKGNVHYCDSTFVHKMDPQYKFDTDGSGVTHTINGTVEFAPLHFAGIKKFQKLWRFNIAGETKGPHHVTLTVVYDPDTAQAPIGEVWDWDVSLTDSWAWEFQPKLEQIETISVKIEDSTDVSLPGFNGDTYCLEAMGAEVGLMSGLARVPLAKRIKSGG